MRRVARFTRQFPLTLTLAVLLNCGHDHKQDVEVNPPPPAEVGGMELWTPQGEVIYREFGSAGAALILGQGDVRDSLLIRFLGPTGEVIPDSMLGEGPYVVCGTTPEGILQASLFPGRPFRIRLEAVERGQTHLSVGLARGDGILYSSLGVQADVLVSSAGWWEGFDEGNAPDGPVRDMVVYRDALVIAGDFTRVGTVAASGVAMWDGHSWSAMAVGLAGVSWLLVEGDLLVAGGPEIGFHRWNVTQWTRIADSQPAATAAALLDHEVYVTGFHTAVMVWRDGAWQAVATDRYMDGYALVAHQGALYVGLTAYRNVMMFEDTYLARVVGDSLVRVFTVPAPGEASSYFTHLKSHGPDLLMAWVCDYYGYGSDAISWIRGDEIHEVVTNTRLWPRGSAVVDGRLYVADRQTVQANEGDGLRQLATVEGGEILDAEEFQGSLYVCGGFTSVGGTPSFRIARWTPPPTFP